MEDKIKLYSVVLLKESKILELKNTDDAKIFEESIILVKLKKNFFEDKSQEELILYFKTKMHPLEYINGYGKTLKIDIVKVIDYFEVLDLVQAKDYTEIYSRHFIESTSITLEDIIKRYYSDHIHK